MAISQRGQATPINVLNQQFLDSFDDQDRVRAEGVVWLRNSISIFENKYGMTSDVMVAKVQASEIEETDDMCSWLIKVDLLRDVEPET